MTHTVERLLQTAHRFVIRGTCKCLRAGPAEVARRLLPQLAPRRVMREILHALVETIGIQAPDPLPHLGVYGLALRREKAAVSDLVCQRMLERIFEIRERPRLVEKLCG